MQLPTKPAAPVIIMEESVLIEEDTMIDL